MRKLKNLIVLEIKTNDETCCNYKVIVKLWIQDHTRWQKNDDISGFTLASAWSTNHEKALKYGI